MADPTKLDVTTSAATRLDQPSAAPTRLDSGTAPSPHIHVQLPPTLAARYRIERQFPAHGAEADVLLVQPLGQDNPVVLKLYRPGIRPKTEVMERIARAAPEHVVQLYEHGQAEGVWYEVLEYAQHGSLRDLMQEPVQPAQARAILDELSTALGYLHRQQIIHRGLKPENILIRRLEPLDLTLIDFGIASVSELSQRHTNLSRTVRYSAPEAASGVLTAKADWWVIRDYSAGNAERQASVRESIRCGYRSPAHHPSSRCRSSHRPGLEHAVPGPIAARPAEALGTGGNPALAARRKCCCEQ